MRECGKHRAGVALLQAERPLLRSAPPDAVGSGTLSPGTQPGSKARGVVPAVQRDVHAVQPPKRQVGRVAPVRCRHGQGAEEIRW